jgi:transcriptional regulator with XRE-family HTH domain
MDWGKVIIDYRSVKKITQEALAEILGVDPRVLRKWESGVTPTVSTQRRLANLMRPISHETELVLSLVENYNGGCVATTFDYSMIATSKRARTLAALHKVTALHNMVVASVSPPEIVKMVDDALADPKIKGWTSTTSTSWLMGAVRFRHDCTASAMRDLPIPLIVTMFTTTVLKGGETVPLSLTPRFS